MRKLLLLVGCLAMFTFTAFGIGSPFTSVTSGNWNDGATWGNASPGVAGTDFPSAGQTATVTNSNIVTIPNGLSISITTLTIDAGADLIIASGGTLALNGLMTINDDTLGSFGLLDISGTFTANQGSSNCC